MSNIRASREREVQEPVRHVTSGAQKADFSEKPNKIGLLRFTPAPLAQTLKLNFPQPMRL
jgi:hypothetical protein